MCPEEAGLTFSPREALGGGGFWLFLLILALPSLVEELDPLHVLDTDEHGAHAAVVSSMATNV